MESVVCFDRSSDYTRKSDIANDTSKSYDARPLMNKDQFCMLGITHEGCTMLRIIGCMMNKDQGCTFVAKV